MKKKNISLVLLGLLIGASISIIHTGNEIDRLYIQKQTLEHDLQKAEERAKKLEEDIQKKEQKEGAVQSPVVKDIKIIIDYQGDEFTSLYLQEYCEEITNKLMGQNVSSLEPELVFQILDERIVKMQENEYKLYVKSVIIAEEIVYNIEPISLQEEDES